MPQITEFGDGSRVTFQLPIHNKAATATVNGGAATIASQADNSVTLASAPAAGSTVVITFTAAGQRGLVPQTLAQSALPASVTGTTSETVLAQVNIPGGSMGANGALRITSLYSATNNANVKTLSIYLGGVLLGTQNLASNPGYQSHLIIRNRNSTASQVFNASLGGFSGVAKGQTTVDTSVDQVLSIRATLATSTDNVTIEGYTVEVLPA